MDVCGQKVPFGRRVMCLPASTSASRSTAGPRCEAGFLGCKLAPGGRWHAEYHVADLSDFVAKCFSPCAELPVLRFTVRYLESAGPDRWRVVFLRERYAREISCGKGAESISISGPSLGLVILCVPCFFFGFRLLRAMPRRHFRRFATSR